MIIKHLYTMNVSLFSVIVYMVTRVQGHPPAINSDSVQDVMNTDEMQVSFVHSSRKLKRTIVQDELSDIGVDWDDNAAC